MNEFIFFLLFAMEYEHGHAKLFYDFMIVVMNIFFLLMLLFLLIFPFQLSCFMGLEKIGWVWKETHGYMGRS